MGVMPPPRGTRCGLRTHPYYFFCVFFAAAFGVCGAGFFVVVAAAGFGVEGMVGFELTAGFAGFTSGVVFAAGFATGFAAEGFAGTAAVT